MNVLILGSGGREHTLAWAIKKSPACEQLYVAPGNAGTGQIASNIEISPNDFPSIAELVREQEIALIIVGPEEPLALGVRDYFNQQADLSHVLLVGPDKRGAQLESSKDFAKQFMNRYHIPTAGHRTFHLETLNEGLEYLSQLEPPMVLKADGLAAGKGVVICQDLTEAQQTLREMLEDAKFGKASARVVIEEFLSGIEVSVFVLTDGKDYLILPEAKDYKRIGEGDTGLNTGGMGAVSPAPFADQAFMQKVQEKVIVPTIKGLQEEGITYKGFIFLGLIKVGSEPYVIEYNVRMGDPETQAVLPRIQTDFLSMMTKCASGNLAQIDLKIDPRFSTTVVMVAGGYPGSYEKGLEISGLENPTDSTIFHAGTKLQGEKVLTNGGRVLAVTSMSDSMESALQDSYRTISHINWPQCTYRSDIGRDLLMLSNNSS